MHPVLEDLIELLQLERIEDNIFRGESRDIGGAQVFGGQVLGQALSAAHHTVEGRVAHSLHAYFLRRGDMSAPIIYEVDRARDGGSFSVRRVVAIQHGRPIFNLAASFQNPEKGVEHQAEMPDVPGPDGLQDVTEITPEMLARVPEKMRRFLTGKRPFEIRPVRPINFEKPERLPPEKQVWIKAVDDLSDDYSLHQNLLAYVSDYELLGTSTLPHGLPFGRGMVQIAMSASTTGSFIPSTAPAPPAPGALHGASSLRRMEFWSRQRRRKVWYACSTNRARRSTLILAYKLSRPSFSKAVNHPAFA